MNVGEKMYSWKPSVYYESADFSSMSFKLPQLSQVIKMTPSLSGNEGRLRLSNRYGKEDLWFDEIKVSLDASFKDAIQVTYNYQEEIFLPQGENVMTDGFFLDIEANQPIYVWMKATRQQSYSDYKSTFETTLTNASFVRKANLLPKLKETTTLKKGWFCLESLEVWSNKKVEYFEFAGDSLMEMGMITTPIKQALMQQFPEKYVFLETAVSGNRLCYDAPKDTKIHATFGDSLLKRIQQNNSGIIPMVRLISIGANDLMVPLIAKDARNQLMSTDKYQAAISQLKNLQETQSYFLNLPPFKVQTSLPDEDIKQVQKIRQQINQWTRTQMNYVDLAPVIETVSCETKTEYDFGDQMHLNQLGGKKVAQVVLENLINKL